MISPNVGNTEFLELASSDSVSLVLAGSCSQGIFQKLSLQLGSSPLWLAQNAINLGLLFEGAFSGSIVLLVSALVVDINDLAVLLGPF